MAVRGFTKLIEACSKLTDSSIGRHYPDLARAYCAYDPVATVGLKATLLFIRPHPMKPPPLSTTIPLPSKPGVHGDFFPSYYP